jgi:hypothetical protein
MPTYDQLLLWRAVSERATSHPVKRLGDSVYVTEHCTIPGFHRCEIPSVHTHSSVITCVSLLSLLRFSDMPYLPLGAAWRSHVLRVNARGNKVASLARRPGE